jgi:hypothetical protein
MAEEISAGTCGTCLHWQTGFIINLFGSCERIGNSDETDDPAYVELLGEDSVGELRTRAQFSCGLWESKPGA